MLLQEEEHHKDLKESIDKLRKEKKKFEDNYNFVDGPFNGILINKEFFKKAGEFPDIQTEDDFNDFKYAKTFWAYNAVQMGAVLKGIAGMRIE